MTDATLGYAFVLGLAGLLNPCGFPLLPAYLSLFAGEPATRWPDRLWAGLRAGAGVTAGFLVVFAAAGLIARSLAAAVIAVLPWAMIVLGLALAGVGVAAACGHGPVLHVAAPGFRRGRGFLAMGGFGVAYALGSLSCSLPVFLAGVGATFASTSFAAGVAAFVAYGLGMGLFVTAASVAAAFAGAGMLRALRPVAAMLPRAAGVVCVLVGLYLADYWAHQLGMPAPVGGVVAGVQRVQAALAGWLDALWLPVTVGAGALVVAALVAIAVAGGRAPSRGAIR